MPFTLALAGGATPRYAVTLSARGCAPVTVDVVPDSALPVTLELLTPRRGRIVLGRVTLSSEYPLGLWHGWAYVHFPLAGIAFPTPEVAPPPLPAGDSGQDDVSVTRGAATPISPGCGPTSRAIRMQRVAWKAVARGAGWHTKQFEGGGGGGPVELAWDVAAGDARTESANRAAHGMGARGRARGAAVRAARAGHRARRPDRDATIAAPRSRRSR